MTDELRKAMRSFATGVCAVATCTDDSGTPRHDALTVTTLTSVSLEPPLVSLCLPRDSSFLAGLLAAGGWAVSILDAAAHEAAQDLAGEAAVRAAALERLDTTPGEHTGALVLTRALGWMECALRDHFDAGDRTVVIGEVLATGARQPEPPLIYLYGTYHTGSGQRPVIPAAHPVSAADPR